MTNTTFTFQVEADLKDRFADAAKSMDRNGAQLLRDFMRDYIQSQEKAANYDAWYRRKVQEGLDQANAGDVLTSEEVEAEAALWRAETRRANQLSQ